MEERCSVFFDDPKEEKQYHEESEAWLRPHLTSAIEFYRDGSFKSAYMEFLTGIWETQSSDDNIIVVTPENADAYEELYYDMDGYIADRDEILKWELLL